MKYKKNKRKQRKRKGKNHGFISYLFTGPDRFFLLRNSMTAPACYRPCLVGKNFRFWYCSTFVCLWQILSNHRLIRVKRFISQFTNKLYNQFLFSSKFNTPCIQCKIRCDRKSLHNINPTRMMIKFCFDQPTSNSISSQLATARSISRYFRWDLIIPVRST